jgi:hypothetical protein
LIRNTHETNPEFPIASTKKGRHLVWMTALVCSETAAPSSVFETDTNDDEADKNGRAPHVVDPAGPAVESQIYNHLN